MSSLNIKPVWLGIDLGSISLNTAIIDENLHLLDSSYARTDGQPIKCLVKVIEILSSRYSSFAGLSVTGSGRSILGELFSCNQVNEILAHAKGASHLNPDIRTIIEIGGQDSKLILLEKIPGAEEVVIGDHIMNDVCAAGTGSFLDQQACRLGLTIEEFSKIALKSLNPASLAGRCSVFAKSDMIHLQQEGVPLEDIVAGLCFALARGFLANLARGRELPRPVQFQGGVAANPGVKKAFETLLGLPEGGLIIPEHFMVMGAYGAALYAFKDGKSKKISPESLTDILEKALHLKNKKERTSLRPLTGRKSPVSSDPGITLSEDNPLPVYLGIDVGAVSANLVLIDDRGTVVGKKYLFTCGRPVETFKEGLKDLGKDFEGSVDVRGVGVTGSGRYFIGHMVGADVVINEITAQARGALHCDPEVDTLLEIGGQDSKYIRFEKGTVVDFEMNKVCAAGTGSFLEEQAGRLHIDIMSDFSPLAFKAREPADLGTRCTVFMESDLIHHQQRGLEKEDLLAGLAYAIVNNYLEKVVANRKTGKNIYFQGGVAGNNAVVSAMESVLGKEIKVHEHYNVTGAIGVALSAAESLKNKKKGTLFAGFNLDSRDVSVRSFVCKKCANVCKIRKIYLDGEEVASSGSICGLFDLDRDKVLYRDIPDLIEERKKLLLGDKKDLHPHGPTIGIPLSVFFFEDFPLWKAYFHTLGYRLILSDETSKELVYKGLEKIQSDTCYPVKVSYGHIVNLLEKGVKRIFFPSEAELPETRKDLPRICNCPYIQGLPYMLKAAFQDRAEFIIPIMYFSGNLKNWENELQKLGLSLGHDKNTVMKAIENGREAQQEFQRKLLLAGEKYLKETGERTLLLFGKAHHIYDEGQNLSLGKKLKKLGYRVIPYDFLPLGEVELPGCFENVVWKNSHDLLRATILAKKLLLPVIMLTNFGCGPDSFTMKYLDEVLKDHPWMIVEIDDHTADAGLITRLEAFLDTIKEPVRDKRGENFHDYNTIIKRKAPSLNPFSPDPYVMELLDGKTLYYHYVSPGMNEIMKGAFKAAGIKASSMPLQDDKTEELGRKYASGLECHPYIVTIGDIAKFTEENGFDPDRTAFFLMTYDGACRYSQYGISYKMTLKNMGYPQIPVLTPLISPRYDEISGLFGLNFTQILWKGWLSAGVLENYLLSTRPYELERGSADRAYARALSMVAEACEEFRYTDYLYDKKLLSALRKGIDEIKSVPVNKSRKRPEIGILGEFFTVLSRWANQDLFRKLESLGAEVKSNGLFSIGNFMSFFAERYHAVEMKKKGKFLSSLYYDVKTKWLISWAKKIEEELDGDSGHVRILPTEDMIKRINPYINPDLDPVSTTYMARVIDFAEKGVSGINYLIVLNCMLSNMTIPVFKKILAGYNNLPLLSTPYDGFKQTNTLTRLEAFVHQAKLYQERYGTL